MKKRGISTFQCRKTVESPLSHISFCEYNNCPSRGKPYKYKVGRRVVEKSTTLKMRKSYANREWRKWIDKLKRKCHRKNYLPIESPR